MGQIYLITCLTSSRYYVGKTVKDARQRWHEHVADVKRGSRGCPFLHAAIRKYGPEKFALEVLVEANNTDLANLERLWIVALNCRNRSVGMNLTDGGDGALGRTYVPSDATRLKLSRALQGRKAWNEGKSGYKVGSYNVRFGAENPFFGHQHSDATKELMRQRKLGRPAHNRKEGERYPSGRLKRRKLA
jgi:group I intron endonuclease